MEKQRISRQAIGEINRRLGDTDKSVLLSIRRCRYLTGRQIMRLHFEAASSVQAAIRRTNRRLLGLSETGLICPLRRRIGGVRAGSGANVWSLTMAGLRLLNLNNADSPLTRKRNYEPTPRFVEHCLAVSEIYVHLHEMAGKQIELSRIQLEPDCWRPYSDAGGTPLTLKPDIYAVTVCGEYEDYWFIEIDLATESPSTVLRKCRQYTRYFQSGAEQRRIGVFPLVVWIVPTDKRKYSLIRHIDTEFTGNAGRIFSVITLDQLEELINQDNVKTEVNALE